MKPMRETIDESRYFMLELDGWDDEEIIATLDIYLANWLFRKNQCPICGEEE